MTKFNEELKKDTASNLDPIVESFLKELRHPSSYSKEVLSKIAVKAMVIIGKESQKNIIASVGSSENS